ncbi:MAG: hypothetical protein ACI8T1_002477 [Verrucomicrobiales bacterium]|jgi:hypothetical protein
MREFVKSVMNLSLGLSMHAVKGATRLTTLEGLRELASGSGKVIEEPELLIRDCSNVAVNRLPFEMNKIYETGKEFQNRLVDGTAGMIGTRLFSPVRFFIAHTKAIGEWAEKDDQSRSTGL